MCRITKLLLLFSLVTVGCGQKQSEVFQSMKKKYASSGEIVLVEEDKYTIKNKNGELQIKKESRMETVVMKNFAINRVKDSYRTSDFATVTQHKAYSINAKNKKFKKTLSRESNDNADGIFYDDIRKVEITYPGIGVGSKKVLEYTTVFKDPRLLHPFLFVKDSPAETLRLIVEVDRSVDVEGRVFNDPDNTISYNKEEKGKQVVHTWEAKEVAPFTFERGTPALLHTEPHVALMIKSYDTKTRTVQLLGSVQDLYRYYWGFIKDLNSESDPAIVELVDRITKNATTDREKVKALYYWVKDNIKYIAYENGYAGFIPRDAKLVRERKFGDCKDMSSILKEMCHSAGVSNIYLTWIGTSRIPYTYKQLPTPSADNHMIAAYIDEGEIIFLDATDSYSPFGMPSDFIQGKEALIGIDENNFKVVTVPIQPSSKNIWQDSITINLEGDKIVGTGNFRLSGYNKVDFVRGLATLNEQKRFAKIKDFTLLGTNKYKLLDFNIKNEFEKDLPLESDYTFELANYLLVLDNELYINPFLKNQSTFEPFDADREKPYFFQNLSTQNHHLTVNIPEGYEIRGVPIPLTLDNKLFYFDASFEQSANAIHLSYQLKIKSNYIYPADFETWNKATQELKQYFKNTLTFTAKN